MEQLLSRTGGLLNRLIGGPQQLGLGALMYGSSEIQKPLKSMFGLPSTGDYLRQWEAQSGAPAQRPPMPGLPAGYKEKELAAGAAAERFRPGAGFPGQQQQFPGAPVDPLSRLSPQDRAYQQERARVEAMVKSNPDMQKEEIAAARAKVRDQGMAIWAAKYGGPDGLASKVKPGQSGYETIQKTLYPGGAPLPAMSAESEAMLNAIALPDATGVRPNVTPMPGQLPAFGNASEAMFQAVTGGGAYITPMPKEAVTPQTQAQDLAEAYRQAMLARIPTNK